MKKSIYLFCFLCLFVVYPVQATLTPVQVDGKYGFENELGELVIPAIYISAEAFNEEGLALVTQDIQGNGWPYEHGYINENGKEVIALRYQQLSQFYEGFALAQKDGKFGYISPTGAVAVDFIYDEASVFDNGRAVVQQNGETFVIERPNWEESTLMIRETDYIAFTTVDEFLVYFSNALSNFDGSTVSESDFLVMEKYFSVLLSKMRPLQAQVEENIVMILSADYGEILAESKNIYASLIQALENCGITPSETMDGYLRRIYNGVANVQYEGQAVHMDSNISYQVVPFPVPYFDKSVYSRFTQNSQYSDYLTQQLSAMAGEEPNSSGAEVLLDYINYIFVNLEPLHISSSWNKTTVGTEKQLSFFQEIAELNVQINQTLAQYNITLKENITNTLLILVDKTDMSKAAKFQFNSEYLLPYLSEMDGIRIVVGNQGQGLYLSSSDLITILNSRDTLYFEVLYGDNSSTLSLFASDGKTEVTEIPAAIFLILPAATPTTTVFAILTDNTAGNWGGIVKLNNTIEFSTTFAGQYYTREARSNITDIDDLAFEAQEKIHFMVSKGFFTLDGTLFQPDEPMTRSDLVCALVKLFFAQDTAATSQFKDVSPEDENYALISAAYQAGIVAGYEDNTFRGSNLTTRNEIISFLSRTLSEYKGYTTLDDPMETIQVFSDHALIADWSVENVAIAIEHNLIETYGAFRGTEQVSRKEVAQLLYTLFLELYDSPYATATSLEFYEITEGKTLPIFPLVLGVLGIIIMMIIVHFHRKNQRRKHIMERMKIVTETLTKDLDENFDEYI